MNTEHFKEKLSAECTKLEEEMQTVGQKNPAVPGDFESIPADTEQEADLMDRATIATNTEDNRAILHDLEIRYAQVNAALSRIHEGTYGTCEVCGNTIEEARLEADPAATTCKIHMQ